MSNRENYIGKQLVDWSGRIAETRLRVSPDQINAASFALTDICNLLSEGKIVCETQEIKDRLNYGEFPSVNSPTFNVFRLTLTDNVYNDIHEYVYIPCAKLTVLTNNMEYIPVTSSLFKTIAFSIQPYYRSRAGNLCTLNSIEYVVQKNTIFPSQVGAATYAPQQIKDITITENGQTSVIPDNKFILSKVNITTNVPTTTETMEKSVNITVNGTYDVLPDTGKALSKVTANVNVPTTTTVSVEESYTANGEYTILPDAGQTFDSVIVNVNVPPPKISRFQIGNNIYLMNELTRVEANVMENLSREAGSSTLIISFTTLGNYQVEYSYFSEGGSTISHSFTSHWYYYHTTNGSNTLGFLDASKSLIRLLSDSEVFILSTDLLTFDFVN